MPRPQRIDVHCSNCGKMISRAPYEIAKREHHFCRKSCYTEFQTGKPSPLLTLIRTPCEVCGKIRLRTPKYLEAYEHHYCGKQCAGKGFAKHHIGESNPRYSRVPAKCFNCDNDLTIKLSDYKPDGRYYCSSKCQGQWLSDNVKGSSHPLWKGGKLPFYGDDWPKQRRMARERDHYTCQRCGVTEDELGRKLDVHHKISFRTFGLERHKEANHLDNLIALCPICHKITERDG